MVRKSKPKKPTQVEATNHTDKRVNIPTAELRDFLADDEKDPTIMLHPRDPSLDPQLVWRGKDEQDTEDLEVPTVPIYIQEKIDPRVLVENLRHTTSADTPEPELTLFDDFDGLEFDEIVDFYEHEGNWSNRLILGDALLVMNSLAEKENLKGQVQMIYIDPPYGIMFGSNWQVSTRKTKVKDGTDASRQPEQVKAFRDTWELGIHSYLAYLRDRLVVARELLTDSGSVFVQIGDENVHLVRSLLDEVFGSENFIAMIPFKRTTGERTTTIPRVYDFLLWYAKSNDQVKVRRLYVRKELGDREASQYRRVLLSDGTARPMTAAESGGLDPLPEGSRAFRLGQLTSASPGSRFPVLFEGKEYWPPRGRYWSTNAEGMQKLIAAQRIHSTGDRIHLLQYLDDFPISPLLNAWTDTVVSGFSGQDAKRYVVQTGTKVVQRCMLMTTDPGDLVVDPTCGSGTTAYVAEEWGRRWITIDTSRVATALTRTRLMTARYPFFLLADSPEGARVETEADRQSLDAPFEKNVRRGFVVRRAPHVTLRSIATNPYIEPGMSRSAIDEAIKKNSDQELLHDQPYEDKKVVRVSGPFTVESLSPHRSLDGSMSDETPYASGIEFESTIIDNLRRAGVQNTYAGERIKFDRLELNQGGLWVTAEGEFTDADGESRRVAVSLGPEHGTVSPDQIKEAAKDALKGVGYDMLMVCGFAFDAHAEETAKEFAPEGNDFATAAEERKYGKLRVLLTRMNPDLAMGDALLKKTGSGNLFTVFGEPDVDIELDGDKWTVTIHGVDVYDPTTGQVRSSSTDDIAVWFIDTNYNSESFFVRHAYFTGAGDPFKQLSKALKVDINPDAWDQLYRTESMPFPKPETGRIAVKVINHYGDEVVKVYDIA